MIVHANVNSHISTLGVYKNKMDVDAAFQEWGAQGNYKQDPVRGWK